MGFFQSCFSQMLFCLAPIVELRSYLWPVTGGSAFWPLGVDAHQDKSIGTRQYYQLVVLGQLCSGEYSMPNLRRGTFSSTVGLDHRGHHPAGMGDTQESRGGNPPGKRDISNPTLSSLTNTDPGPDLQPAPLHHCAVPLLPAMIYLTL